jgi:hypothetical protein
VNVNGFIKLGLLAAAGMVGTGIGMNGAADAAVVFQDRFEYQDQAAFDQSWTPYGPTGSPVSGTGANVTLSDSPVKTGAHAAFIPGNSTAATPRSSKTVTATGTAGATNVVSFSFDFYDASAPGAPQRNYVNLQSTNFASGSAQLISLGLSNAFAPTGGGNYYMARILGYNGTGSPFFKLDEGDSSTLRQTGWNNLRVDISDAAFTFYVDGALAKTVQNTLPLRSYESMYLGSGLSNGNVPVSFDNIVLGTNLVAVPEPTSLALIGLAGFGLLSRRRRGV